MRKYILRWLGIDAVSTRGYEALGRAQLQGFRDDTHALTTAVEFLAGRLHDTVTREEVTLELNERLERVEQAHAGALSGTKNQLRRTRNAAWWLWGFLLLVVAFLTVQLHDMHIAHCVIRPPASSVEDFVCTAAFPFANHDAVSVVHQGLANAAERTGLEYPTPVEYKHAVDPRLVGMVGYGLMFGGATLGLARYRRAMSEERDLEVGDFTEDDLDTLRAAQDEDAHLRPRPQREGSVSR